MKKTIAALWLFATVPALAQNPISPMGVYIADPSSRVVDGRLYVYGSLDVSPGRYCSKDYHVLSSPDLRNWTLHPYSFRNDIDLYAPDMKTLDMSTQVDGIVTEKDHFFHEGSYVVKRGGYYYFIFADISRNGRPTCLGYAMATSPLGPYEYKGVIIDNAGCDPETWNNHGSLVQFGDDWYVLYHRSTHGSRTMRKACIEPVRFNPDGTIDEVEMTSQGAAGPLDAFAQLDAAKACRMQGHVRIRRMDGREDREELAGIHGGDAAVWKYLDFGTGARHISLRVRSKLGGTVIVRAPEVEPLHRPGQAVVR